MKMGERSKPGRGGRLLPAHPVRPAPHRVVRPGAHGRSGSSPGPSVILSESPSIRGPYRWLCVLAWFHRPKPEVVAHGTSCCCRRKRHDLEVDVWGWGAWSMVTAALRACQLPGAICVFNPNCSPISNQNRSEAHSLLSRRRLSGESGLAGYSRAARTAGRLAARWRWAPKSASCYCAGFGLEPPAVP